MAKIVVTENSLVNAGFINNSYDDMELVKDMYQVPLKLIGVEIEVIQSDDIDFDWYSPEYNLYFCNTWIDKITE